MFSGLFKRKKNKELKQYVTMTSTNFDDADGEYMKPIYTIQYHSKLNKTVLKELVFSKDLEDGIETLSQALSTLEDTLKDCIEHELLVKTLVQRDAVLTIEEEAMIEKLEDIVKYKQV